MSKEIDKRHLELVKLFGKKDIEWFNKINIDKNLLDSIFKTKLNQGFIMSDKEVKSLINIKEK